MNDKSVGIFDSGIGGLTVVRQVSKLLPNEKLIYFGDTARVPYGSKSPQVVREFALQDALFLSDKNVKAMIIACNTASAEALDLLQKEFDIPIIGVIKPGAGAAANVTKNGKIGVIGTYGTIASGAYKAELLAVDSSLEVESAACPLLVPLVEEGWESKDVTKEILKEYLSPLTDKNIDTLILGCTHYPILKPLIQEVVGDEVVLIDSAEASAAELERILNEKGLSAVNEDSSVEHEYYVSDFPFKFKETAERFLGKKLPEVGLIPLDHLESLLKAIT